MELDTNTPVSDEQRRLAESKKITVQPMHTDLRPDDLPDAEIATRHILEPAIPNIEADTEQNTKPIQPSKSILGDTTTKPRQRRVAIAFATAVLLVGATASVLFIR